MISTHSSIYFQSDQINWRESVLTGESSKGVATCSCHIADINGKNVYEIAADETLCIGGTYTLVKSETIMWQLQLKEVTCGKSKLHIYELLLIPDTAHISFKVKYYYLITTNDLKEMQGEMVMKPNSLEFC